MCNSSGSPFGKYATDTCANLKGATLDVFHDGRWFASDDDANGVEVRDVLTGQQITHLVGEGTFR